MGNETDATLTEFFEFLITVAPEDRAKHINNLGPERVPHVSTDDLVEAVEDIDLHYYDEDSNKVHGHYFWDSFDDAGFAVDVYCGILGEDITEEGSPEEYEFATSLTEREREGLKEHFFDVF